MTRVDLFFLLFALVFLVAVLRKTIHRKMLERDSLLWILFAILSTILALRPQAIKLVARWIGVDYAPSLLFLVSTMGLLYIVMSQSLQLSKLNARVIELGQRLAIQECLAPRTDRDSSGQEEAVDGQKD